jgi:acetoacetyl-CoA synthetase
MLMQKIIERHGFADFRELHRWSIAEPDDFWREAWTDLGVQGEPGARTSDGVGFEGKRWFPDARLNVVNTLLAGNPDDEVLVALAEDAPRRSLTRAELRTEVAACAAALRAHGVVAGDRVAAWTPNITETVIFALGALSIGAVVSTASTDFGPAALIDRFAQIEPTVLLVASSYRYGGKQFDLNHSIDQVAAELPTVSAVVVIGSSDTRPTWDDWLEPHRGSALEPEMLPFDHPGFILFSSGTTGRPKCIVHSAGGILLKVLSEQGYHLDVHPRDRVLYATTCGWMMWNWLVFGLGRSATIVLADGSPGYPDVDYLWSVAHREKLTFLGVSAALIDTWRRAGLSPRTSLDLSSLRTIASTGSPLAASGYDWVASEVSPSVAVASIAGGTDLCGCLVLGVHTEPVVRGEIQGPALGLDVTVLRADGSDAEVGEDGELVCRTPFPTVPLRFWGDDDGSRRHSAYFDRFPDVWAHGDYARRTPSGGFEILGRLDATLNVKGVRIGTAEIYRVVLALPGVHGAMAIEQPFGEDTRIVLFVVLDGELDSARDQLIRQTLRTQASPRHVPSLIVATPELPVTRSGKMTELAVADILTGRTERDTSSLSNPNCLEWFREWARTNSA